MAAFELPSDFQTYRSSAVHRSVTVVNAAISGTTSADWLPNGIRYPTALAAFRAVMNGDPSYVPKAMLVSLGTNDGHTTGTPIDWQGNMSTIIAAFRSDLGLPNLPVIFTIMPATVPTVNTPPAWDNWAAIRSAQLSYTATRCTGVQMPEGTYRDGLHFDAATNLNVITPLLSAAVP